MKTLTCRRCQKEYKVDYDLTGGLCEDCDWRGPRYKPRQELRRQLITDCGPNHMGSTEMPSNCR